MNILFIRYEVCQQTISATVLESLQIFDFTLDKNFQFTFNLSDISIVLSFFERTLFAFQTIFAYLTEVVNLYYKTIISIIKIIII